ncbi:hypothetical protein [Mucilaginibacter sp. R-33]|uniref:hypothetical protein n=1 Tax=unclassified Mucilaginibacter TaxID=2617802 RepID=UPI003CF75019
MTNAVKHHIAPSTHSTVNQVMNKPVTVILILHEQELKTDCLYGVLLSVKLYTLHKYKHYGPG